MAAVPRLLSVRAAVAIALLLAARNIHLTSVGWLEASRRIVLDEALATTLHPPFSKVREQHLHPAVRRRGRRPHPNLLWPPLRKLIRTRNGTQSSVGNEEVIGDVQHLLDFVIAGHPKTGTTSLMAWLSSHPQVLIKPVEVQSNLKVGNPAFLIRQLHRMYRPPPANASTTHNTRSTVIRGYKAPNEIHFRTGLRVLAKYWPNAKLVVGVRHPVHYFSSWYNFKLNNYKPMPPPELFNGKLDLPPMMRFHENLSHLGKTNLTAEELSTFGINSTRVFSKEQEECILVRAGIDPTVVLHPVRNRIFLYDAAQADTRGDPTVSTQFRVDLSSFLGVSLFPELPKKNEMTKLRFDICQDQFVQLRRRLVELGHVMSTWILTHFVIHPDVTIACPESFEALLRSWSVDPCPTTSTVTNASAGCLGIPRFDRADGCRESLLTVS